ncbi:L-glutamate gamma-semialdehyde dehydrogenase [Falsirhodobacter sp. alg1]|uniref:L-glutamate gamma-semialdehyde dehydrogenase n=1 Tax=Falsirhodobacter sp. alg1 TaxID=1472418 RepID=UPI0007876277|nr:L-glutamate gamma-semialdehyde dehydrogenase [Falsirhodobacter sp. alg1]
MTFSAFTPAAKTAPEGSLLNNPYRCSEAVAARATDLIRRAREGRPGLMERFLGEYGLSTAEGVALMTLAEALLRVPDSATADALIADRIVPADWKSHAGQSDDMLINAATRGLMVAQWLLPRAPVVRPVVRHAAIRAMKEMGRQFVLGENIRAALQRARKAEAKGYTYSYDMLGEAAMTAADAKRYARSYSDAIATLAEHGGEGGVADRPGISVKLSALHPRYEVAQQDRVMAELVPVVASLARQAAAAGIGFNIDAEEQDRLVLSLRVIEDVLADPALAGWDGFGVVVQAYGKRSGAVIDWLAETAKRLDRRLMVRLVKGAYWDTEMKRAQVDGHEGFPLFTRKAATDVNYLTLARKLFGYSDCIYPQFATHNAHTVAAVLEMAAGRPYEFQRLHGMGEGLHDLVLKETGGRCRIYAPVGAHRDLLAYLVRRLLENGANSSFVNQMADPAVPPSAMAGDPALSLHEPAPAVLREPADLFGAARRNSRGWDLTEEGVLAALATARAETMPEAAGTDPATALNAARTWDAPVAERARVLRAAADLHEAAVAPIIELLMREGGKTWPDAIGELREAVDFLRYYATEAETAGENAPRGIITAISPWNFPLAIFLGQVCAALATGNAVLAKPAEQTPRIAALSLALMHKAGVPETALQLVPGDGPTVGVALTTDPRVAGVVFTGSTGTAHLIRRAMAASLDPGAPLIAETGGLNAMIVDSTALPEQAVRDIVGSAFRSAGQRCSALRCLYLQEDIAPHMLEMIRGAMDELVVGDPANLSTDVGPVIDTEAQGGIADHIAIARAEGRILHQIVAPKDGIFIAPTMIGVNGIADLKEEIFGPVLHVATFAAKDINRVVDAVNEAGYGLTFGLHSRITGRIDTVGGRVDAGNLYVNRNQIGAVVGSQPFGGEGLSGTGPKAGGPLYLGRFRKPEPVSAQGVWEKPADLAALERALGAPVAGRTTSRQMPGPTGEENRLTILPRGPILCLGPGEGVAKQQAEAVRALGGHAVIADGAVPPEALVTMPYVACVLYWGPDARSFAQALARREGPIVALVTAMPDAGYVLHERHLCIDTTAAGGNAALLAG